MTQTLNFDDLASSVISAAESARESSVAVMVALAPVIGPFPAAAITGMHAVVIFGNHPLGWAAAFGVVAGVEATGIGLSATSAALKRHGLIDHAKEIDLSYWIYAGVVLVANAAMSIQAHGAKNVYAIIFESALATLPIFVQKMIAKNAEISAIERAAANNEAKDAADKAQESERNLRMLEMQQAHELAVKAAEAAAEMERLQFQAVEAEKLRAAIAKERAERAAMKSASVATAPANSAVVKTAPATATKQPCKFGCGKLVTGTAGQNAHSDKCPNNPANK